MVDDNGVLTMQRLLLAGTLGLSMAQKAAAILEGEPDSAASLRPVPGPDGRELQDPRLPEGAVLRAILDAANDCLGHFDDRPQGERWCDALLHLLDLASFAADLGFAAPGGSAVPGSSAMQEGSAMQGGSVMQECSLPPNPP